jgi:hypothetical protein
VNFQRIDDQMLLANAKGLALQEREILLLLLKHLKEIHRRRLFCDLKYSSMKEYIMEELKYPEDQADRRLSAMHLLAELPEIEAMVEVGSLNLTNMVLAQTVFNKAREAGRKMSREEKLEFVNRIEDKTTREAMRIAYETCPEMKPKDLEIFQLKDLDLRAKAKELQKFHGTKSLSELLHKLFDAELERLKPRAPAPAHAHAASATATFSESPRKDSLAEIRSLVYRRDQCRCTNCQSPHDIEYEHIIPKAAGGGDTLENLKLLCRDCNLRQAILFYGPRKMEPFLREPVTPYGLQ